MAHTVLGVLDGPSHAPRLADPEAPIARADDVGLGRGDGCFETCRVLAGGPGRAPVVERLQEHLERFAASARLMDLAPPPAERWAALAQMIAGAWTPPPAGEGALKLMLTRGVEGAGPTPLGLLTPIAPAVLRQRAQGVAVVSLSSGRPSTAYQDAPWLLAGVKSLSYALNMAAMREAARRGADDAILLSTDGFVLEAPTATVVWSTAGVLGTTPTEGSGILVGTTQRALFAAADGAGIATQMRPARLEELAAADALWLLSSVRGVAEVTSLNGQPIQVNSTLTHSMRLLSGFAETRPSP